MGHEASYEDSWVCEASPGDTSFEASLTWEALVGTTLGTNAIMLEMGLYNRSGLLQKGCNARSIILSAKAGIFSIRWACYLSSLSRLAAKLVSDALEIFTVLAVTMVTRIGTVADEKVALRGVESVGTNVEATNG
ncbi:hypothetical protein HAX54_015411 [Datura stramonium]|uniref:Uncharacterized protein n=1 Tax=Datura stramonium TaxID=4076 RepID=A0ABS8TPL1_DATST|nr:hypothetical protein [Datura stramonium]